MSYVEDYASGTLVEAWKHALRAKRVADDNDARFAHLDAMSGTLLLISNQVGADEDDEESEDASESTPDAEPETVEVSITLDEGTILVSPEREDNHSITLIQSDHDFGLLDSLERDLVRLIVAQVPTVTTQVVDRLASADLVVSITITDVPTCGDVEALLRIGAGNERSAPDCRVTTTFQSYCAIDDGVPFEQALKVGALEVIGDSDRLLETARALFS